MYSFKLTSALIKAATVIDTVRIAIPITTPHVITGGKYAHVSTRIMDFNRGWLPLKINWRRPAKPYEPSITLIRRPGNKQSLFWLELEMSLPKLVFGNNLQELSDEFLSHVIWAIQDSVGKLIGYELSEASIQTAEVNTLHIGKNLLIPFGRTVEMALDALRQSNLRLNRHITEVKFQNGQAIHFRTKLKDIVVYDKIAELESSNTIRYMRANPSVNIRALEHAIEAGVIRLEVRVRTKSTVSALLSQHRPTLETVFSTAKITDVLIKEFETIIDAIPSGLDLQASHYLANALCSTDVSTARAMQMLGMKALVDEVGLRSAAKTYRKTNSKASFYRLMKDMSTVSTSTPKETSWIMEKLKESSTEIVL